MPVRSGRSLSLALLAATTLSGCALFPGLFPFPAPGPDSLIVENATDEDWILSVSSDFPSSFAIPAGETGEVYLYQGIPTTVELLDLECIEVADLAWEESFTGVRIGPPATLTGLEGAQQELTSFAEYFDCGYGEAPTAVDLLPGGSGTLLVIGGDGSRWALDVATANLTPISSAEQFGDSEHTLSADGTQIAFSRFSETGTSAVYVASADGTDERLLVDDATSPAWSPDGTRIAYLNTDPFAGGSALSVVDLASGHVTELAERATGARWSPDGARVAFILSDFSIDPSQIPPGKLQIVDADGTDLETLGEAAPYAPPPAWSPEGRLIAFTALAVGASGDLFNQRTVIKVYDVAGGRARTVADVARASATEPAWSPDGTQLAFTVSMSSLFRSTGSLAVVSTGGGDVEQVGSLKDAYYVSPIWSPDGTVIAATRSVGVELTSSLVAFRLDSSEEVVLATSVMYAASWRLD